jgi:hypothetical protein
MKRILNKLAAIMALIIGAMAVFAGGKVLLGIDPGYYVIDWVPVYNFSMGVITVFFTAVLLWKNHRFAWMAAGATLAAHALVMIVLQTMYRSAVAQESIQAMTIRIIVWVVILSLIFLQSRIRKGSHDRIESKLREAQ